MPYLAFVSQHRRFLAFGFALAFFSSFGQSFFIALFAPGIQAEFDLSHGDFGTLYSIATLASGFCLIWLGHSIDYVDLRLFSALVCAGLVAAAFAMATVPTVLLLGIAIFGLRITGQGLLSHTAMTSMARYFDATRGKAMAVAGLGFPAGEAVLPLLAVVAIEITGWRQSWLLIGEVLAVAVIPAALILLRGHARRHREHLAELERAEALAPARNGGEESASAGAPSGTVVRHRSWTRREVLRDPRFYMILPGVLAPGFIVTGLFIHQGHLVSEKGWDLKWYAACFVGFAAAQLPASLLAGPLVDRFGARRLVSYVLAPLAVAVLALAGGNHPAIALVFLVFAGLTSGVAGTTVGAMWAELYGVAHHGSIRALVTAFGVFATALSPASMGWLIDRGVTMETIALLCLGHLVIGTALLATAMRMRSVGNDEVNRSSD